MVIHIVLRDDGPVPDRPKAHPVRFHAWNLTGRATMLAGSALYRLGLEMCGWAGWLDAKADAHR